LQFNYTDVKSEEYTIDFKTMTETCTSSQTQRQIIRHADFDLPQYWQVQSENVAQFQVQANSDEYNGIRALFDKTMVNQYTEILSINRIQNKPWYMQYNSYKSFSSKKDKEKKLFHGCPQQSAQLIMHSFFNRSFAGINGLFNSLNNYFALQRFLFLGTVYGQGAYFSANAKYSHSYAHANTLDGERCMFVANVLVGDSIKGNTSMKTPPAGYDSTTDGQHIFVTYRDDQAYAAYLIVYK
jgi:poly [ADP-ribose] polymerase 7/11/12/13